MALVLAPEPPAADWLHALDAQIARAPSFFDARPVIVAQAVRSGQSIVHEAGDVTIIGSVASGAEIVAGGSIHIYGALRGRAIAGLGGSRQARIFCSKLHAELLAIEGVYKTADDMDPKLHGRSIQAWLDGEHMSIAAMD
jgi:septum site-determining protein MinC